MWAQTQLYAGLRLSAVILTYFLFQLCLKSGTVTVASSTFIVRLECI